MVPYHGMFGDIDNSNTSPSQKPFTRLASSIHGKDVWTKGEEIDMGYLVYIRCWITPGSWVLLSFGELGAWTKSAFFSYWNIKSLIMYTPPQRTKGQNKWINPDVSTLCWRECGGGENPCPYMQCLLIQPYWKEVLYLIKKISKVEIRQDPWQCLFHASGDSRKNYRATITPFLLNTDNKRLVWLCG